MDKLKNSLINLCMNYPKMGIFLCFFFSFVLIGNIADVQLDFTAKNWFRKNDPNIQRLNIFEKKFGNDESVILIIDSEESFFNESKLKVLSDVTEAMWQVHEVIRVESLINYSLSFSEEDDIRTEGFAPPSELGDKTFIKNREKVFEKHRVLPGVYLSEDKKTAVIYGWLVAPESGEVNHDLIYSEVQQLAKKHLSAFKDIKYYILGSPALNVNFKQTSFMDLKTINPVLLALIIIYLIFCFRNFWGVFFPLAIIITTLLFMFGLIGFLGIKLNGLTLILPGIVVAIAIADSVHLLTTYFNLCSEGNSRREALRGALDKNMWPIFLTSISTTIGFFSLMTSDVKPIAEMGLLAGIATLMALVFSFLLIPSSILLFNVEATSFKRKGARIKKETAKSYIDFLKKWHVQILGIFFVITFCLTYLGLQNEVNSNPFKYFKSTTSLSKANDFVLEKFKGVGGPEFVIDSGKDGGVTDPSFLKKVDEFQDWLHEIDHVNRVVSIIDIIKEVNQSLNGGKEEYYKIPDTREMIAQEVFLYTLGLPQGMDLNNRIDIKQRELRLSVLWSLQDSKETLEQIELIEQKGKELGLNLGVTGKGVLFQMLNSYVVKTFASSMGLALVIITLILIVVFKSFKIGFLSLIPNMIPILLGAGLLTIIKTPIDVGCAMVASVTLGIAVDDTIHFLSHYNILRKKGIGNLEALTEVIRSTGVALIITTLILVSAFGLFMFARLVPNMNFGILSAFVLLMALVCDLIILPAILIFIERFSGSSKGTLND